MKLKMLIVEDEEALLDLLKFNFNKEGYKIDTATDGETALEKILYKPLKVLDKGFVRVVDYMGNDNSIVQAARVSYGKGTKKNLKIQALLDIC